MTSWNIASQFVELLKLGCIDQSCVVKVD